MRHYISILAIFVSALTMVGCNSEFTTYSGPEYVGFADSVVYCPVLATGEQFEIEVATTVDHNYDRTFGVEVVDAGSSAVEGVHFTLPSNSFTIKAGERKAVITLQSNYNNFESTDNYQVQLRLITPEDVQWDLYETNQDVKVVFIKRCPLDLELYDNRYCVVTSSMLYEFTYEIGRASCRERVLRLV